MKTRKSSIIGIVKIVLVFLFNLISYSILPTQSSVIIEAYKPVTKLAIQNVDGLNRFQVPSLTYYIMLVDGFPTKFIDVNNFINSFTTNNQLTSNQDNYHYSNNNGLSNFTHAELRNLQYVYEGSKSSSSWNQEVIYFYSLGQNASKKAFAYEDELTILNTNLRNYLINNHFNIEKRLSVFNDESNLPTEANQYYVYANEFNLIFYKNYWFQIEEYLNGNQLQLVNNKQIGNNDTSLIQFLDGSGGNIFNKNYKITIALTEPNLILSPVDTYDIYLISPEKNNNFFTFSNNNSDLREIPANGTIYFYSQSAKIYSNLIIPKLIWTNDNGVTFSSLNEGENQINPINGERNYQLAYFDPLSFAVQFFRFAAKSALINEQFLSDLIELEVNPLKRECYLKINPSSFLNSYSFEINNLQIGYFPKGTDPNSSIPSMLSTDNSSNPGFPINSSRTSFTFSREGTYRVFIAYNSSPIETVDKTCNFPALSIEFRRNVTSNVTTLIENANGGYITNQAIEIFHNYDDNRILTYIDEQKMEEKENENGIYYAPEVNSIVMPVVFASTQKNHTIYAINAFDVLKKYTVRLQDSQNPSSTRTWEYLFDTKKPTIKLRSVDQISFNVSKTVDSENESYDLQISDPIIIEKNDKKNESNEKFSIEHQSFYLVKCNPSEYSNLVRIGEFLPNLPNEISGKKIKIPDNFVYSATFNIADLPGITLSEIYKQKFEYTPCSIETPYYIVDLKNENGLKTLKFEIQDLAGNKAVYEITKTENFSPTTPIFFIFIIFSFIIVSIFLLLIIKTIADHCFKRNLYK